MYDGYIYTSSDSGATWSEQIAAGAYWWGSVASSADGTKLSAVVNGGYIYTSTDSGATWTEQTAAGSRSWRSIASSADGTKLTVAVYDGYIYTSSDSGATWSEQTAAGLHYWSSIASSGDGKVLAALDPNDSGYIYTSSDSGATWSEQTAAGSRQWYSLAFSSDGTKLTVAAHKGGIYLGSMEGPTAPTTDSFDFGTLIAPTDVHATVSQTLLSVMSSECYTITPSSTAVLSPAGLTVPETNVTLLGGIAFNVTCDSPGGSTDATVTLGSYYSDTSKLRIYKRVDSSSTLEDITEQVTITNTTSSSNMPITNVSYTLVDGGAFDEDGIVNGTIVDPLYIGVVAGSTSTTPTLADTGENMFSIVIGAAMATLAGVYLFSRGYIICSGQKR